MTLSEFVSEVAPERSSDWAWFQFKGTMLAAIKAFDATSILEVGGGRCPTFSEEEIVPLNISYTINDIDQSELDLAPNYVHKQCFDIGGNGVANIKERYDFVFSRFVFEHLTDAKRAYENIFGLLKPGGVCLNYYPCLYTLPFVINKLLPTEKMSSRLLLMVFGGSLSRAKFPATYSWCYATPKVSRMLDKIGYKEIEIIPFYGHIYYDRIPVVRDLHKILSRKLANSDARWLASFAYTMARG
jgi:SAM-dependent methyltransferase